MVKVTKKTRLSSETCERIKADRKKNPQYRSMSAYIEAAVLAFLDGSGGTVTGGGGGDAVERRLEYRRKAAEITEEMRIEREKRRLALVEKQREAAEARRIERDERRARAAEERRQERESEREWKREQAEEEKERKREEREAEREAKRAAREAEREERREERRLRLKAEREEDYVRLRAERMAREVREATESTRRSGIICKGNRYYMLSGELKKEYGRELRAEGYTIVKGEVYPPAGTWGDERDSPPMADGVGGGVGAAVADDAAVPGITERELALAAEIAEREAEAEDAAAEADRILQAGEML